MDLRTRPFNATRNAMTPVLAGVRGVHMVRPFLDAATHLCGPVISVGSGMAGLEAEVCLELLMMKGLTPEVWCIDPAPASYNRAHAQLESALVHTKPFILPTFRYLTDFRDSDPVAFSHLCTSATTLLLVWTYPGENSTYDMQAVVMLRPARIVTLCEPGGAAGGEIFLQTLAGGSNDRVVFGDQRYRVTQEFPLQPMKLCESADTLHSEIVVLDRVD